MPENLVEDLAAQYTAYKATNLTFADTIRLHPVAALLIIVFFFFCMVAPSFFYGPVCRRAENYSLPPSRKQKK